MMWRKLLGPHCDKAEGAALCNEKCISFPVSLLSKLKEGLPFRNLQKGWQNRMQELFLQNADQLLWCATVITGDSDAAVDCLLEAADQACEGSRALPAFFLPGAKLLVIHKAIHKMRPYFSILAFADHVIGPPAEKDVGRSVLSTPDIAHSLLIHATQVDLLPALLELDCLHRTVYLLCKGERWTCGEVANTLQMPENRVLFAERIAPALLAAALLARPAQPLFNHEERKTFYE